MNSYRGMMEATIHLYDLYQDMLDNDIEYQRISYIRDRQEMRFLSIIQNNKYSPAIKTGNFKVNLIRKTSFCNKRIGCKRKRRKQL